MIRPFTVSPFVLSLALLIDTNKPTPAPKGWTEIEGGPEMEIAPEITIETSKAGTRYRAHCNGHSTGWTTSPERARQIMINTVNDT